MKLLVTTLLLFFIISRPAHSRGAVFAKTQCQSFEVSEAVELPGEEEGDDGVLRYCDNGTDQQVYLSGSLDTEEHPSRDLKAVNKVIAKMKKRKSGVFEVITEQAGGGETEWHSKLIMAVEDSCKDRCRIETEVRGKCESACNQLHITCVQGATTLIRKGGETCDHAETDESDPSCRLRDPNPPHRRVICPLGTQIAIYRDRCGKLVRGRGLRINEARKKMLFDYVSWQAKQGIFGTEVLRCNNLPWADVEK